MGGGREKKMLKSKEQNRRLWREAKCHSEAEANAVIARDSQTEKTEKTCVCELSNKGLRKAAK